MASKPLLLPTPYLNKKTFSANPVYTIFTILSIIDWTQPTIQQIPDTSLLPIFYDSIKALNYLDFLTFANAYALNLLNQNLNLI